MTPHDDPYGYAHEDAIYLAEGPLSDEDDADAAAEHPETCRCPGCDPDDSRERARELRWAA